MSWFSKLFEKDEWRLCGTVETGIIHTDRIRNDTTKGTLYYYLYENQHGDRKFDVADTFRGDIEFSKLTKTDVVYRCEEYLEKVKPWLGGRKVTGVASYDKTDHHDLVKRLKEGE